MTSYTEKNIIYDIIYKKNYDIISLNNYDIIYDKIMV